MGIKQFFDSFFSNVPIESYNEEVERYNKSPYSNRVTNHFQYWLDWKRHNEEKEE